MQVNTKVLLQPRKQDHFTTQIKMVKKRSKDLVVRIGNEISTRGNTDTELDNSGVLKIVKALQFLSENDQEILRLVAWEKLSHKEISVVFGCSENAVSIRIHRARMRLTKVMQTDKSFLEIKRGGVKYTIFPSGLNQTPFLTTHHPQIHSNSLHFSSIHSNSCHFTPIHSISLQFSRTISGFC